MILKLGGSILTDKNKKETIDLDSFEKALKIVSNNKPTVLVHGAGSFGHPHAETYNIKHKNPDKIGIYETHKAVCRLNQKVVEKLWSYGADSLPIHPLSCSSNISEIVDKTIKASFLPVIHGDIKIDPNGDISILSGDKIAADLSRYTEKKVGFCTSTGGVLDTNNQIIENISSLEQFSPIESQFEDVTGSMAGKIKTILELDRPGYIFGLEDLDDFLDGKKVGTQVTSSNP